MKTHQSILTTTVVFLIALSGSTLALEPVHTLPKVTAPTGVVPDAGQPSGPRVASDACPAANVGTLASGGGSIVGSTIGSTDDFDASANGCGDNTGGKDEIFEFDVDGNGVWAFDTCTVPACWDTTLSIREDTGGGCPGDQVACDGDGCNVCVFESGLATFLTAGTTYYLIVDGWSTYTYGDFEVTYINAVPACSDDASCDDGIFCNGSETCDVASGACNPGAAACLLHETCDEASQSCVQPDPWLTWRGGPESESFFPQANLCPDTATWVFDDIQTSKHATDILDLYTTPILARSTPEGASPLGTNFLVDQAIWTVEELSCNPLAIIAGTTCTGAATVDAGGSPAHDLPCTGTMPPLPNNDGDFNRCEVDFFIAFRTSENGAGMGIAAGQQHIGGLGAQDEFGVDVIWVEDCPPTGVFSPTFFGDDENLPADFAEAQVCQKTEVQCWNPDGSCSVGTEQDCADAGGTVICTSTIADGACDCEGDEVTCDIEAVCTECECCDDGAGETNPIYLFSGEKYESVVDMRIPGRGLDFVWSRKYRSKIGPDTAMGNGWDFSYNIRLEQAGQSLILRNGDTRVDTYTLQPNGTWTRREFFRVISQNPDGSFTVTHSDTGRWEFQPFDGSPHQGKITASVDRNGNTMRFDYDGLGRLVTVHDPLDTPAHNRDITIAYNADGFIESVTDFAGRSVIYTYYPVKGSLGPPTLAPAPEDIRKNRYISIDTRGAGGNNPSVLDVRLTLTSTLVNGVDPVWIGSEWWANAPDANCISIVGPSQPISPPNWSGCPTVHLTGCATIPTAFYDIVVIDDQGTVSAPLAAETQLLPADEKWWGDAVGFFTGSEWSPPQGVTNFDDVTAALKTFQDPNGINATHTSWTDIHPNRPELGGNNVHPNRVVNIDDVFQFIKAFQGEEYPGGELAGCTDPDRASSVRDAGPRVGGGGFGDLKSVTTPVVQNTAEFPIPAGHDYPDGKTTIYTYSTGFADDRLNHNLLTITDPKGQTYLRNEYDPTTDPTDLNFDRVRRQTWGDPDDHIDIVYVQQVPSPGNNFAVIKAILNDRVGNVREYFYDGYNRNVLTREYTGRADPDLPTTESDNRPTGQLRPGDPPFFEKRYEHNLDSLRTNTIDANGNQIARTYDDANASRRSQGNLLEECRLPGVLGGDQAQICETYEYDDNFGGCCGTNFITKHVDGRGNETLHTYDSSGNRLHTQHRIPSIVEDFEYNQFGQTTAHTLPDNGAPGGHRRRDEYTYYSSGPQLGYLKDEIVDAPNFALTTTHEYNLVGRTTRVIDPRGHDTQAIVNQLDQTVRTISREVADGGGVRYERDTFYDPNDNIVRVDIQNKDHQGILQANTHFTTIYEYEILDYLTRSCSEVGDYTGAIPGSQEVPVCAGLPDSEFLGTKYAYDADRNRTLDRYGEAVEGRQPTNVVETLYDERDLTFREIRAPGDPDQSTTQYDYDENRNLVRTSQGIEDVAAPRITTTTYDGYDRRVAVIDPMGNVTEYRYDPNNNLGGFQDVAETVLNPFAVRVDGELDDVTGSAGNIRMTESWTQYDEMDRVIRTEVEFFDTDTQTPLQGGQQLGKAISTTEYNDNSQVTRVVNDNLHETLTAYDTANRRSVVTDAKGNLVRYEKADGSPGYDANSNVIAMTEVEKSDLGDPDEEFTATYSYDNLDRLIQTVDNVGNTNLFAFDSRDNQTLMDDALSHETRYAYDGINRLITTIRDLDGDSDGDGQEADPDEPADIVTTQTWDDTSRLTGQGDDNGNITTYQYDALNRMTAEVYADTTAHAYVFDVHDNKTQMTDANGSVSTSTYDLLDRMTDKTIAAGADVSTDITFEVYKYDGISRLIHAKDDDSLVTRSHDSLFRVTRETLEGETTTCLFDGVGNELVSTYPGGRVIESAYDELERKKTITDTTGGGSSNVASYDYVGPGRVERREYGNGTRTDYAYDGITGIANPANDFGVKRIIGTKHSVIAGGVIIDDRSFIWDKMYNKLQREDTRAGGPQYIHDYEYDAVYRLVHTTVTDPLAFPVPVVLRDTTYDLDGVGNRTTVAGAPDPGPHVGTYTMDATEPDPADFHMNQYTDTSADARIYDENGNLIRIDNALPTQRNIKYDYRNQMVEYLVVATGVRHTYAYDALSRRIVRVLDAGGVAAGPTETRYFYDAWQVVEDQDAAGITHATYVYGLYIDEVLNMKRGGADFYYHTDDLYNVMALTNAAAVVVERYEYADYGQPIHPITLAPIADNPSAVGNPYGFTGRRYDPETAWYHYRTRYLDPTAARFTSRDSIGIWGDGANLGNAFAYVSGNPWTFMDPFGADKKCCGVKSFSVKWTKYDEKKGKNAAFSLAVEIEFKKGGKFDPACCEYKQNAGDKYHVKYADGSPDLKGSSALADDGYSRTDDEDGKPALSDPGFSTSDIPGWSDAPPANPLDPKDDIVEYKFTAEQIVYSPGSDKCVKNDKVAKKGPHTGTIKGKHPRTFTGVPKTL